MLALGLGGVTLPERPARWTQSDGGNDSRYGGLCVECRAARTIGVFAMDRDSGELTMIDKVAVPGTDKPSPASMPMAVTPDRRFIFAALRSDDFPASSFAIDHATGRLAHVATTPLADSMAYINHRPHRAVSACRVLSRQQADDQPDRRRRPYRREDHPDHPEPAQIALHPGRCGKQILLRDEPRRRHRHGVEIRSRRRDIVAERAGRGPHQARRRAAAYGAAPQPAFPVPDHRDHRHDRRLTRSTPRRGHIDRIAVRRCAARRASPRSPPPPICT